MNELITRSTKIKTIIIDSFMVSDWLVGDSSITVNFIVIFQK